MAVPAQPLPSPCPASATSGIWGWKQETEGPEVSRGQRARPRAARLDARLGGVEDFGPNGEKVAANAAGGRK